ncbi:hypothetical protein PVAG01_06999 [Phlyctema vagabunda]|uniref:Uncharacterized protein n=1 Tax=Phlyctema vagabunda TaxID=108571 RepID=A0ABR4PB95_9HELO
MGLPNIEYSFDQAGLGPYAFESFVPNYGTASDAIEPGLLAQDPYSFETFMQHNNIATAPAETGFMNSTSSDIMASTANDMTSSSPYSYNETYLEDFATTSIFSSGMNQNTFGNNQIAPQDMQNLGSITFGFEIQPLALACDLNAVS